MEHVIRAFKCQEPEKRMMQLRLELDQELDKLYQAMMEKSTHKIDQCKARLREIRREMLLLELL